MCKVVMDKCRNIKAQPPFQKKKMFALIWSAYLVAFLPTEFASCGQNHVAVHVLYSKLSISNAVQIFLYEPHNEVLWAQLKQICFSPLCSLRCLQRDDHNEKSGKPLIWVFREMIACGSAQALKDETVRAHAPDCISFYRKLASIHPDLGKKT